LTLFRKFAPSPLHQLFYPLFSVLGSLKFDPQQLIYLQEKGGMTAEIKKSMAELIAAYNREPVPSASTNNRSIPLRTTTSGRGGTTEQNATPTERTMPHISDTENASKNPHLNISKLFPMGGKSSPNPEATRAISNHLGSDARELMITPGHSIIVYLRDGMGGALGFNSNTGFAGEFRADVVQKVEPQPEVPLKVAIAICDRPVDTMTNDRHVHFARGDDGWEFTRFESDSPELGPVYPQLDYKYQDSIIIFFKKDVSAYGLNLRTGGIGQFMARNMHYILPTDRPKLVMGEPKGTRREAAGGKRRQHREFDLPFMPPTGRPKPVRGEPKGTRREAAGGKRRQHRVFDLPFMPLTGRPKPVRGEPKGTRREAAGGKRRPQREFESCDSLSDGPGLIWG
jgi:hypothetical protein